MNKEPIEKRNEQLSTYGVMLPPNFSDIPAAPNRDGEYTLPMFNLRSLYAEDFNIDEIDDLYERYLEAQLEWSDSPGNPTRIMGPE